MRVYDQETEATTEYKTGCHDANRKYVDLPYDIELDEGEHIQIKLASGAIIHLGSQPWGLKHNAISYWPEPDSNPTLMFSEDLGSRSDSNLVSGSE